jgi:hypothetical protein
MLRALCFAVIVLAPAPVEETALLEWKFEKDKTFYLTLTTDTDQTMNVMGNAVKQKQNQTFVISWTPLKQDDKKNWVLKQRIEAVRLEMDLGGNKISYDSEKDAGAAPNPVAAAMKAMVGAEFTVTLSPEMKVIEFDGREALLKKLGAANPQGQPMLSQILSEDGLKQMAETCFGAIPNRANKAVKKGESWQRKSVVSLGPLGAYETKYDYTYAGPVRDTKLEKLSVKAEMTYKAPAEQGGALPFTIKSCDLKSSDATGTIEYSRDKGRVEKSTMKMDLKGKLAIEIGGQTTEVELSQTQTTTATITDEDPLAK